MSYLTSEQRRNNKDEFIRILKSTRRKGLDKIISDLEKEGFFDAQCYGHDRYPGGTLNHCLWVCKMALETWKDLAQKHPEKELPHEYNVIIVSLLHDVCDSSGFNYIRRWEGGREIHGKRSKLILEQYKRADGSTILVNGELNAIKRHMHPKAFHRETVSTRDANDWKTLLHYILKNADGRSIEYYGDIPYDTAALKPLNPSFNPDGYMYLPVRVGDSKDIRINELAEGGFTLSLLDPSTGDTYKEIKELISCKNFLVYISRFPAYRDSYVLVQSSADGLWRSYRINRETLSITPVCANGAETPEDARKLMKHGKNNQYYTRVMHSGCFESIDCGRL